MRFSTLNPEGLVEIFTFGDYVDTAENVLTLGLCLQFPGVLVLPPAQFRRGGEGKKSVFLQNISASLFEGPALPSGPFSLFVFDHPFSRSFAALWMRQTQE